MRLNRFNMPPGVESALRRAAKAAKAYGYPNMQVCVIGGEVESISFFDELKRQTYVKKIDGHWCEHLGDGELNVRIS